ncbi:hypothetical protein IC757_14325 [Wenzhouxiangella sp. AB-CW3]|uniref:hypothetical protein n=1 Tax=Wenzhouxiangella sp. AB-CW3 TaxID=2771012 RepID=UPI00168BDAE4|nr:hypothetical protein [Wenzhouxiangella sp. AB-CW3]QOC22178.1 hypothetical protein IC757_14325 [Wenzhouxiangella sp. AB-CW3]
MINRQAVLGFLLGLLVVGALWLWVQYRFIAPAPMDTPDLPTTRTEQPAPADRLEPALAPDRAFDPADAEDVPGPTVPELFGEREPRIHEPSTGLRAPLPGSESVEELMDIQQRLLGLSREGLGADPDELRQVLGRLRATLGTDEVAGVNLQDLETTVDVAGQMRSRAQELSRLAEESGEVDHSDRMMELFEEISALQSDMPNLMDLDPPGMPDEESP